MRLSIDKVELSASEVASLGVPMIEVNKRRHIGAKSYCRGFEYTAMIHIEQESEVMEMGRTMLLEVATLSILPEVGHQVACRDRHLALFVTVHTPKDAVSYCSANAAL
jgi:hypothetical protein